MTRKPETNTLNKSILALVSAQALLWSLLEQGYAVEFEPAGKALAALLGTTKVFKKTVPVIGIKNAKEETFFYSKKSNGRPNKVAVIEKGIYEPNCTHTWAIGLDADRGTVTNIRVIEMSCPHSYPTRAASFMDQFKGKGPADLKKLDKIDTIAKATGSSLLARDAVKKTITAYWQAKGKL